MNRPLRLPVEFLLLSLIAATAAGCGGGDSGPAGTADDAVTIEPWDEFGMAGCDLVTDDEVAAAVGEAVTSKEEGGYFGCRWQTGSQLIDLGVFATTSLPADSCAEGGTSMPYGQSAQGQQYPVSGLGDAAIWGSSGNLLVCTGRGLLVVDYERSLSTMSPEDEKAVAIEIARHALGRLAD